MKRFFLLLLVTVLCVGLVGCTSTQQATSKQGTQKQVEKKIDIGEAIKDAITSKASVEVFIKYGTGNYVNYVYVTTKTETSPNHYNCKGKVTIRDAYGDAYEAKYDAVVVIDKNGKGECETFNMETPRKK